jgi:hypothetical protein
MHAKWGKPDSGENNLAIMQAGGWTTPHVVARYVERASTRRLSSGWRVILGGSI